MTVTKEAQTGVVVSPEEGDLALVNQFSKVPLTKEQVYLFSVRLCDNQVDRDLECFDRQTLVALANLFVGKTGIFDHNWTARNQTARIYRTELVAEAGANTETGEPACFLKGYAYMLRTEGNADLIAEIDAGIKKEVSVSCAVTRRVCSICGNDIDDRVRCNHEKGGIYEGKRCVVRLVDPTDAYEWSFVAVPAQREAGVIKQWDQPGALQKLLERLPGDGTIADKLAKLEREAACGRQYLKSLRKETLRLGLLAEVGMEEGVLDAILQKLELSELEQLQTSYAARVERRFAPAPQLRYAASSDTKMTGTQEFMI